MKANSLHALSHRKADGTGLRIAIVHAKWNAEVVGSLVSACKKELLHLGVEEQDVVTVEVSGAYELPYAATRIIVSEKIDAVVCVGCLIKGETMHFEYISESVAYGTMRVQLDYHVPIIYGVLSCLNEQQARERAGLTAKGTNHGKEWAQTAIEMAQLRAYSLSKGCPMGSRERLPHHHLTGCPFFTVSAWLHVAVISAVGVAAVAVIKKMQ